MVTNRLVWYLERNKIITPAQCGFRKQRSTSDHLVHLERTFDVEMNVVTIKLLYILMQRTFMITGRTVGLWMSTCTYVHISYRDILWNDKQWICAYTGMCVDVNVVLLIRQRMWLFKQLWTIISTVKHDLTVTADTDRYANVSRMSRLSTIS